MHRTETNLNLKSSGRRSMPSIMWFPTSNTDPCEQTPATPLTTSPVSIVEKMTGFTATSIHLSVIRNHQEERVWFIFELSRKIIQKGLMAEKMLHSSETNVMQNHEDSFSVKSYYDMIHLNACTGHSPYFTSQTDVSSSLLEDGSNGEINSSHANGRLFEITLSKSYVKYLFTLRLPCRVGVLLPSFDIMSTFVCNGRSHKIKFFGQQRIKMFGSGWKQFVEDHNLMEGDCLKFEVVESNNREFVLSISILRRLLDD